MNRNPEHDRFYAGLLVRGLKHPTLRTLYKLAGILGVKPSRIVEAADRMLEKGVWGDGRVSAPAARWD